MLSYLYYLFIAPLEWLMRLILEHGCQYTGSYGLSLILLSLVVSVLVLPLYHLAESWQEKERLVQLSMKDYLPHIRKTFKGRERYMLIRTVYRQHDYHPLYSLRCSAGFLIQVPFFFAAYHFLSNYAPLDRESFWIIKSLGSPDALLTVFGLHINVLPIIMTLTSLVSAFVYTSRLQRRDKIQLYVLAGIFLVVLYPAPSGLVLYWTCNNVFSLVKNIVYEKLAVFSHDERAPKEAWHAILGRRLVCRLLHVWTIRRLAAVFVIAFMALDVRILTHKSLKLSQYASVLDPASLAVLALCFALLLCCLFCFCLVHRCSYFVFAGLFCATGYALLCHVPNKAILFLLGVFLVILLFAQENKFTRKLDRWTRQYTQKDFKTVSFYAAGICCGTVFFVTPAMLMAQDASLFSPLCLALLTICTAASCLVLDLLFKGSRKTLCFFWTTASISLAFIVFIYTWLLTKDYGVLDSLLLTKPDALFSVFNKYVDLHVCLFCVSAAVFLLLCRRRFLILLLKISLLATVVLGLSSWYNVYDAVCRAEMVTTRVAAQTDLPIKLSREAPNVLVIMLDMFTGDHIRYIREEYPESLEGFDGFTWYPDTVSEGSGTSLSLPSIIAGPDIAPRNLLQDDGISLEDKIDSEIVSFFSWLDKKGFTAQIADSENIDFIESRPYVQPYLYKRVTGAHNPEAVKEAEFPNAVLCVSFGFFRAAPLSLRKKIYRSGKWLGAQGTESILSRHHYAVLKNLGSLTAFDDNFSSHYTFFHSLICHMPWRISGKTLEPVNEDPYPDTVDFLAMRNGRIPEHYYTEACALKLVGQYFDLLKKEGVYDNTFIIVLSDHCPGDSQAMSAVFGNDNPAYALTVYPGRPDALLLIKPFRSRGSLKTDTVPMATSDVRKLVEAAIEKKSPEFKQDRVRYHAVAHWMRAKHPQNNYNLDALWKVTGDRSHREHWSELMTGKMHTMEHFEDSYNGAPVNPPHR